MDVLSFSPSVVGSAGGVLCPCGTVAEPIENGFRHRTATEPFQELNEATGEFREWTTFRYVDHFVQAGVITGWNEATGRTLADPGA